MRPDQLINHPEGGKYQEVFRSTNSVHSAPIGKRSALTHIYFQLATKEISKFHKVTSEEVWNLYKGDGLKIYLWNQQSNLLEIIELSEQSNQYCHVVPAGCWQAAEPIAGTALAGCTVAPGFEFADFTLLSDCEKSSQELITSYPHLRHLV